MLQEMNIFFIWPNDGMCLWLLLVDFQDSVICSYMYAPGSNECGHIIFVLSVVNLTLAITFFQTMRY